MTRVLTRATVRSVSRPMPVTDAFILIGTVRRLSFRSEGTIYVQKWGRDLYDADQIYMDAGALVFPWATAPPQLYWSRKTKALYVFPRKNPVKRWKRYAGPDAPVFQEYDRGARQDTSAEVDFPEPRLFKAGRAFDVVYRSDKWDKVMDVYHHEFDGPTLYASEGKRPVAFVVKGGRLTVNDRGIIH